MKADIVKWLDIQWKLIKENKEAIVKNWSI